MVDIQLSDIDSHPELSELVGRGSLSALDDNKGLIAQRNSGGKVRVYVTLKVPFTWSEDSGFSKLISSGDIHQAPQHLLTYFSDWSSSLQRLIADCDMENSSFAVRPLFSLPSHSWDSVGRVTLLGDAAHIMVPFAGEGANLAMLDAAELGDALAASKNEEMLNTKVGEYEKVMLERANNASEESMGNMNLFISQGGAEAASALMKQLMAGPPPGA
jgi:2-polyprenyl-6-methoxyphenol hydroxylase-like FAD-dependent oxidoreductase